jgi:hypothetical protein
MYTGGTFPFSFLPTVEKSKAAPIVVANKEVILPKLLKMIGQPYEEPDGCIIFVKRALLEFGVEIDGRPGLADARLFVTVRQGGLGTVIVWKGVSVTMGAGEPRFHVGLMLDRRWALQSCKGTNGVGRVEVTRNPWAPAFKGFYRPKKLCS